MKRTIYLAAIERHVTLAQYIRAVKLAKANPDRTFRQTLDTWWPGTGKEIVDQFLRAVDNRINHAVPYISRGTAQEDE